MYYAPLLLATNILLDALITILMIGVARILVTTDAETKHVHVQYLFVCVSVVKGGGGGGGVGWKSSLQM